MMITFVVGREVTLIYQGPYINLYTQMLRGIYILFCKIKSGRNLNILLVNFLNASLIMSSTCLNFKIVRSNIVNVDNLSSAG